MLRPGPRFRRARRRRRGAAIGLTEAVDIGRKNHRGWWVQHVFAPLLRPLRGATRDRAVPVVIAATDVYVWELLRRDDGLERADADTAV